MWPVLRSSSRASRRLAFDRLGRLHHGADREDPELAEVLAVADPLMRYPRPFDLRGRPDVAVSDEEARDALQRAERIGALIEEWLSTDSRTGRSGPSQPNAE